jgi:hypothetical protein
MAPRASWKGYTSSFLWFRVPLPSIRPPRALSEFRSIESTKSLETD